jgi:arabinogalactan endo-1,4-beta-galactosidase
MLEKMGEKWQNAGGTQEDCLQILKDKGINSIRLRTFVNPNPDGYSPEGWVQGFCEQAQTISMAVRAKNMGFRIMIDFQYADNWSSTNAFDTPSGWTDANMSQLETSLYNYTYNFMQALVAAGVTAEWVQVGNEILNGPGFCWPLGQSWTNLDALCGTGYNAVKAASPSTKVVIHIASAGDAQSFIPQFFANGGKADAFGFSFYPYYSGGNELYPNGMSNFVSGCNYVTQTYNMPVYACEIGGLDTNPANTNTLITAASNYLKSLPNGLGMGTFYWEPESNPSDPTGYALGATSQVSSDVYKFTTALDAYTSSSAGNYVSNPGFEADGTGTSSPAGWNTWNQSGSSSYTVTTGGAHTGTYYAIHWNASAYSCSTYQQTYVPNGTYTLTAWVKSSGGQSTAQMYTKGYGGNEMDYSIKNSISSWTQITISNINVTCNWIEFGFYSNANANNWIYFDDVSLIKN